MTASTSSSSSSVAETVSTCVGDADDAVVVVLEISPDPSSSLTVAKPVRLVVGG